MRSLAENFLMKAVVKNDIRLRQAEHDQKPAVIIFGRVTILDGLAEKLFYKAQRRSGLDKEAARKHCWNSADAYTEKLNDLYKKIS